LPMAETDLESDHAGGDGRFQLPYTRLSPLNSTQPAVIYTQPAPEPARDRCSILTAPCNVGSAAARSVGAWQRRYRTYLEHSVMVVAWAIDLPSQDWSLPAIR
jgi:hypothetical protein